MAISKHFPFTPHIITCLLVSFLLLLSGCSQPDNAASSAPEPAQTIQNQTTQAPVKKSKTQTTLVSDKKYMKRVACIFGKNIVIYAYMNIVYKVHCKEKGQKGCVYRLLRRSTLGWMC